MSYCRWSSDNWKCDLYCYEDVSGGITTHVAGNRIVGDIPEAPLSLLGKTEGHYYDYNNPDDWLFMLAETHVSEDKALEILETLAKIGSIDKELWQQKIIWSQHFVDNLTTLYVRRKDDLPLRPGNRKTAKPRKEREDKTADDILDPVFGQLVQDYEDNIGMLSPMLGDRLKLIHDEYPEGWFAKAVEESVANNKRNLRYIEAILTRWKADGINPLNGVPAKEKAEAGRTQVYNFE